MMVVGGALSVLGGGLTLACVVARNFGGFGLQWTHTTWNGLQGISFLVQAAGWVLVGTGIATLAPLIVGLVRRNRELDAIAEGRS